MNRPIDYYEDIFQKLTTAHRYCSEAMQMATTDVGMFEQFLSHSSLALDFLNKAREQVKLTIDGSKNTSTT